MTTYILIHGSTQGPAGWLRLERELQHRGHCSISVDLAGIASGSTNELLAGIDSQLIAHADDRVVVAHSVAGVILPLVATRLGAKAQVWIAGWIPSGDATILDELQNGGDQIFCNEWLGVDPINDHLAAAHFLFHDCTFQTLQWAVKTLRHTPLDTLYSTVMPIESTARSTVIVPRYDRTVKTAWLDSTARLRVGNDPIFVDSGHCPHVSEPNALADILSSI